MVQLVEREGYTSLISEVFIEETTLDETLSKVFQAFLRMVEQKHSTVEEVLPLFTADDFAPAPWETEHASQVGVVVKLTLCFKLICLKVVRFDILFSFLTDCN